MAIQKRNFFSSYVCHPSMANNELSGPVLLNALIKYVKKIIKKENLLIGLCFFLNH